MSTSWFLRPRHAPGSAAGPAPGHRPRRGAPRPALLAVVAMLAVAVLAGGCTAVRNDLGTAASECYVAIPPAADAVHHHGKLYGVRLETVSSLKRNAPKLYEGAVNAKGKRLTQVCLVAFGGDFTASDLTRPVGKTTGRLAIVELGYPDNQVLLTLVVSRPPIGFGHPHI